MTKIEFKLYMMLFERSWVCMMSACAMRVLFMRLMKSIKAEKERLLDVNSCFSCADFMWEISYKTKQARRANFALVIMISSLLEAAESSSWADDCIATSVWSDLKWTEFRWWCNALNKLMMMFSDDDVVSKNWSTTNAQWLSESNESLIEFHVFNLKDCCRCNNQAKINKKDKLKVNIDISLYVSCYNVTQIFDVDHSVWSSISKSSTWQAQEKTYQ